ncbi:MAG: TonB-dependent receptor [Bacteroidales bacterium]|nr:TonB-dependent receptor [Bacteroidales bacterium]
MKQKIRHFAALLCGIFLFVNAFAQVTTSSLSGLVSDEAGAPLAGATVVAVHTPSGTVYSAVANENGRYNISGMRPGGPYVVEISFLGMGRVKYSDVILKLGEPFVADAGMKPSNELEALVFTAEGGLGSNRMGAGSNFDLSSIENVPTIDRSLYDVVKLNPQASLNRDGGISFTGTNNRYNSFQIDGAIANDAFGLSDSGTNGGQTGVNPVSMDAIEEIQVVVAPFDVRQSGFTGGAMNAVTKAGTNEVKGSFYGYFNNQDFIGTTAGKMDKGVKRERYASQNTQTYGFTVGAPIIKNKLFIFAGAEYNRDSSPNVYTPVNGSYDALKFSAPVTVDGTSYDYFSPEVAQAVIDHYKKNYTKGVSGFSESIAQHQCLNESISALARLDWNINDDHKLMLRYQFTKADADRYESTPVGYYFNNSSYRQSNMTNTIVAELNSRISDMVSNEFRATAVFVRDHRTVPYNGANVIISDGKFITSIGTETSSGANGVVSDVYTIADNVSILAGNHNITVGTHNEIFRFNNIFLQYAYGGYNFYSMQDFFDNKVGQFNYSYADPTVKGVDGPVWAADMYAAQFGLYAQDEWRPNRNFTLTYGVRADMPMLLNTPTVNKAFNETDIAKDNGEYVGTIPAMTVLFSPRIGFRWFVDEDHRTLLRGGAGIFTGRVPFVWLQNAYNNTGVQTKGIRLSKFDSNFPLTSSPYEDIIKPGLASGSASTVNTLNSKFKYPQTFRVNLGFEQDFGAGWKFIFDALYSKSFNNVFFTNLALSDEGGKAFAVSPAVAEQNPNSVITRYTQLSSNYSDIYALQNTDKGYSYSLSGQIQKHFDFGLDLMAAYTYGRSYAVNDGLSSVAKSNWRNYLSEDLMKPELSYSLFDKPHKITGMISYTSPMYARMKTTVSLIYEGSSGNRYSYVTTESKVDFNGDGQKRAVLAYVPASEEVGLMSWASEADAQNYEKFIRADGYLSSRRGQFSERFGGRYPFEHQFNLHVAQDFYYDRSTGRKVQLVVDFMNVGNLLNREWGLVYSSLESSPTRSILTISSLDTDSEGNVTPTYSFSPQELAINDFYSRWRCQIGLRLTF